MQKLFTQPQILLGPMLGSVSLVLVAFFALTDRVYMVQQPGWTVTLILLAGLAAWFEVPIEPYGSVSLSPVIYLVASASYGVGDALFLAFAAPLSGSVIGSTLASRKIRVIDAFEKSGEAVLSLGLAALLFGSPGRTGGTYLLELSQLSVGTLVVFFLLRLLRVSATQRVALRRLLTPLARRMVPHLIVVLLAVPLVWLTFVLMGNLGMVLSLVVLVETYYPWKLLGEQRNLFLKSLQMMSNAVDLKDPYTAHHSRRVAENSVFLARRLGVDEEEVERIRIGGLMHDIGKIAVPGRIIRKPSKLTDEEMNVMKRHVEEGAGLIQGLEILEKSTDIVKYHHENFDGSGYPDGLSHGAIPFGARIVFVADAFDALTTDRPYRKGRSKAEAIEVVRASSGIQFDPKIVEVLERDLEILLP